MLALAPSSATNPPKKTLPNLLPAKIHHSGPVPLSPRYWAPSSTNTDNPSEITDKTAANPDQEQPQTSYLRGRKLLGRTVNLPPGYEGMVLQKTDNVLPSSTSSSMGAGRPTAEELRAMEEGDDEDLLDGRGGGETSEEVKVLEPRARFDGFVVWGHESVPEDEDVYVRGVEEWVRFAEAMHCDDMAETNETK